MKDIAIFCYTKKGLIPEVISLKSITDVYISKHIFFADGKKCYRNQYWCMCRNDKNSYCIEKEDYELICNQLGS